MFSCHDTYLFFKTLGKSLFHSSQWCVIQTFVHATMWHNTEPGTLGVSIWASLLFVTMLCMPGFISAVLSPIISRCWLDRSRTPCHGEVILTFTCRICPSLSLVLSSAGPMEDNPSKRTIIIALGMLSISLYVLMVAWRHEDCHQEQFDQKGADGIPCKHSDKQSFPFVSCFLKLGCTSGHRMSGCSELLIGVLFAMGIRWCSYSINILYENFIAAVVMFIAVSAYSFIIVIEERCQYDSILVNSKSSSNDTKNLEKQCRSNVRYQDNRSDVLSVETQTTCPQEKQYSSVDQNTQYYPVLGLPSLSQRGIEYYSTEIIETRNSSISSNDIDKEEKNHEDDIYHPCNSKIDSIPVPLFLLATFLGLAVGSLCSFSMWIFTSPSILCRWGEVSTYREGYAFFLCFVGGCIFACLCEVDELYCIMHKETKNHHDMKTKKTKHRLVCQFALSGLLCSTTIGGTCLILLQKQSNFVVGGCMLSITFPSLTKILLEAMSCVVQRCKLKGERKSRWLDSIPGIILLLGGVVFTAFHVLSIMFINPQLSSFVFGKIGRILFPEVIAGIVPLLAIPLLQKMMTKEERPCSSSTGPLLEQSTANEKVKECVSSETTKPSTVASEKKCTNPKFFQIIIIILFSITVCLSKYCSYEANVKCNEGWDEISRCHQKMNSSYDIRAMSWNILLGHKMNGRNNLEAVSRVINHYNPHFIALQESDPSPAYWGGKNVMEYLQFSINSCTSIGKGLNPMLSSLGVSLITRSTISNEWNGFLPYKPKLPNYSVTRITTDIKSNCEDFGSGNGALGVKAVSNEKLHVYSLHAVYKNWTCPRYSNLSSAQMQFVIDDISTLPRNDPVIVIGDFNINPSESELGIWFKSNLGFQSALWPGWDKVSQRFSRDISCSFSNINVENCDCDSLNSSSDPPRTTLVNRRAAVDHIFYRRLKLVNADIIDDIGNVSDHYPIYADFVFGDTY